MLKKLLLILVLIFSCSNRYRYTFTFGEKLVEQQERAFIAYKNNNAISQSTIDSLESNLWVSTAIELCPSNLVIRNLCLVDLLNNESTNKNEIHKQLEWLGTELWQEGYSYWRYTIPYLAAYADAFNYFQDYINAINYKFRLSAYKLNDTLYPAPFGDIMRIPLENQDSMYLDSVSLFPIKKTTLIPGIVEYSIEKCFLGFNTHVPNNTMIVLVTDYEVCVIEGDSCRAFPWYVGYTEEYKNELEALKSVFHRDRVTWILVKKWWRKYIELNLKYK